MGTTSSEIIKAEHFDMAVRRVSISNAILSIKNVARLNWIDIFESINCVEKILSTNFGYEKLDYNTKEIYRNAIKNIAKKANVSEIYVANQVISLASEYNDNIGEFLIGDKQGDLFKSIDYKKTAKDKLKGFIKKYKFAEYIFLIYFPTVLMRTSNFS